MKSSILIAILLIFTQFCLAEDPYAVTVQSEFWHAKPYGSFADINHSVSLSDIGINAEGQTSAELKIEHPLDYIPQFRMSVYNFEYTNETQLEKNLTFQNLLFSANESLVTEVDLSHVEISSYYTYQQNTSSIYLGVSAKTINGELLLKSKDHEVYKVIDKTLPLITIASSVDLIRPNLQFQFHFTGISMDRDKSSDIKANISYQHQNRLNIIVGYRHFNLSLKEKQAFLLNTSAQGPFIGAYLHL